MKRVNLRCFLLVVTVLCIALPPICYQAWTYKTEQSIWSGFFDAKTKRDFALTQWQQRQKAGDSATLLAKSSEEYYFQDALVRQHFQDIVEKYQLELGPNGHVNSASPDFHEARKKYQPKR